ncbi:hypothetical protein ACA040_001674 [Xenophilus aerolatus]
MKGPLRQLAVTVMEDDNAAFRWAVAELSPDDTWTVVQEGRSRHRSYHEAMAEGLRRLQAMVPDLDDGPRKDTGPAEQAGGRKPTASFGFGFGLPKYRASGSD